METLSEHDKSIFKGVYQSIPQLRPVRSKAPHNNFERRSSSKKHLNQEVFGGRMSRDHSSEDHSHVSGKSGTALRSPVLRGSILASIPNNINFDSSKEALGDDPVAYLRSTIEDINEVNDPSLSEAVDKILAVNLEDEMVGADPRPRIIMDAGDPVKDVLFLTNIPKEMTYDRLQDLVEPFGGVSSIDWDSKFPSCASVHYEDASSAEEAMQYLSDSIVAASENQAPLKAELSSAHGGTQLFVGDLTPDVTEAMLEECFGNLVQGPVTAVLKRDPGNFSPIGYGFLSFADEFSAGKALVEGHRMAVGNAKVRVGKAERNTFLYVSDLNFDVSLDELKHLFGQHGDLIEEDTVIVRRSYAFIRYRDRRSAESAKRSLDKTPLRSRMSVRYAEAEAQKSTVQIQFHSSVPRPPSSLKDLLHATFSKYGFVESIEIPRLHNGTWRKTAFVQYHGDSITATIAATDAVQNVKFISNIPVLVQFARELIPRVSPRGNFTSIRAQPAFVGSQPQPMPDGSEQVESSHDASISNNSPAGTAAPPEFNVEALASTQVCGAHEDRDSEIGGDSRVQPPPRNPVHYPKSRGEKSSRSGSFDRSRKNQRRSLSARRGNTELGAGAGDVQFVPVYVPVSAVGHRFPPAIPGMLNEPELSGASAGFIPPPFHGSVPPLMYPGPAHMQSPPPPGPFGYCYPMMGANGVAFDDQDSGFDGFSG